MPHSGPSVRVLVATDGSDHAVSAAQRASELFVGADFTVLAVARGPDVSSLADPAAAMAAPIVTGADGVVRRAFVDEAHEAAERTCTAMGDPQDRIVIEAGGPGEEICRVASEREVDVVVVGSRGFGGIRRALLGSVSDHVVRFAPCPVLVVRERPD